MGFLNMNDITREIEIMSMVAPPNVIKLFEIFDEPKKMHLVTRARDGRHASSSTASSPRASYAHEEGRRHRDEDALRRRSRYPAHGESRRPSSTATSSRRTCCTRRPADDANLKVADFGLARMLTAGDMMKTACGTPGYVAPEILKNKGYDSGAVDMWSAGVILYILLCGFPPFYEEELPALFDQILHARYDFPSPWWDNISADGKDLVKKLLELDVKKRLTAAQVLAHPWMGAAPTVALDGAQKALKKYNASRKLKKVAGAIIAQKRMERALAGLKVAAVANAHAVLDRVWRIEGVLQPVCYA